MGAWQLRHTRLSRCLQLTSRSQALHFYFLAKWMPLYALRRNDRSIIGIERNAIGKCHPTTTSAADHERRKQRHNHQPLGEHQW
jgi:hypothetical protein